MNRLNEAAESIGLSLEMLYRAADKDSTGKVPLEDFKVFLKSLKIKIPHA